MVNLNCLLSLNGRHVKPPFSLSLWKMAHSARKIWSNVKLNVWDQYCHLFRIVCFPQLQPDIPLEGHLILAHIIKHDGLLPVPMGVAMSGDKTFLTYTQAVSWPSFTWLVPLTDAGTQVYVWAKWLDTKIHSRIIWLWQFIGATPEVSEFMFYFDPNAWWPLW